MDNVRIFLDTEFSSLNEAERDLIALALVSESTDDALYIVLANGWDKREVSPFVRDTVLPMLTRYGPEVLTRAAAAARIEEWLDARRPDPEYAAELEALFLRRAHALRIRGGERHHALVDAKMMKAAFQKVAGGAA